MTFYFERTMVDYFHIEAESREEAIIRLRTEPDRYNENRTETAWMQTDSNGYWQDDIDMEDKTNG